MKKISTTKIIFIAALIIQSFISQGQELKLNYAGGSVTLPLDQSQNLNINPITGNIDISTTSNAEQIGNSLALTCTGDAPSINLTKVENGTNSANINWSLGNDPVYCVKSGLWSGTIFGNPIVPNSSESVFANGSYSLTCHNSTGSNTDTVLVSNITAPASAPTLNLSTSPTSIDSGASVRISWDIANTPTQCIKTGDWPTIGNLSPSDITNGNHFLDINNVTLNRTYSLECTNSAGTSNVQTATVTLNTSNTWPSCSGASAAILNGNEDRAILAQGFSAPTDYNGLFSDIYNNSGNSDLQEWPGSIGSSIKLNIKENKYVAARFTTPNEGIDAQFLSQFPSNFEGAPPSGYTVSISECPGDFNVHLNQPACKKASSSFRWTTSVNPTVGNGFFCELEQNKTYYLNIVHSTNQGNNNYQTTTCLSPANSCGHLSAQNLVIVR